MKDNNVYIDKDNLKYIILRKRENSIKVLRLDFLQELWFTKSFFKTNFTKHSKFVQINIRDKYFTSMHPLLNYKFSILKLNIDKRFNKLGAEDVIIFNFIKRNYSIMTSIKCIKIFDNSLYVYFEFITIIDSLVKSIINERQQYL